MVNLFMRIRGWRKFLAIRHRNSQHSKVCFSLVSDDHYDRVSEQVYKCVRGQTSCVSCIFKGKRKNGKSVLVEIYGVRTRFYGKPVLVGALRKIRM